MTKRMEKAKELSRKSKKRVVFLKNTANISEKTVKVIFLSV